MQLWNAYMKVLTNLRKTKEKLKKLFILLPEKCMHTNEASAFGKSHLICGKAALRMHTWRNVGNDGVNF